jgi:hypothetical protein
LKNAILANEPILLDRRKALQAPLMNLGQTMGEADKRMTLAYAFVCPVIIVSRSRIAKIIFKSM